MSIHRKIIFEKERQVNTYAHMWHTALILRKTSRNAGKDTLHMNRACLVFIAFSMEAFLNHVGHLFVNSFDSFDSFERLKIKEKILILSRNIGFNVDFGHRPWQIVKPLFSFRNDIAHGKTTPSPIEIRKEIFLEQTDSFQKIGDKLRKVQILTPWEKFCTEKNIERAMDDVRQIFKTISKAAEIEDDLFIGGYQSSVMGPLEEDDL